MIHRNRRLFTMALFLGMAVIGASCAADKVGDLKGKWTGTGSRGTPQEFVFMDDQKAFWIFSPQADPDTFSIRYEVNYDTTPHPLTLRGFNRGFLQGRALYGIIEFVHPDTFRVDFEPGPIDTNARAVRPRAFTDDAIRYSRKR